MVGAWMATTSMWLALWVVVTGVWLICGWWLLVCAWSVGCSYQGVVDLQVVATSMCHCFVSVVRGQRWVGQRELSHDASFYLCSTELAELRS